MAEPFIAIEKDGERIEVHPDALDNHLALGWRVVESVPVSVETLAKNDDKPAGKAGHKK